MRSTYKILGILLAIFIGVETIFPSEAKVGYNINICVNNSTMGSSWGKSHTTIPLIFHSDGKISGIGNSSKYISIEGFSGIGLEDRTSTKEGGLRAEDRTELTSEANYIYITQTWDNGSANYHGEINESMPTLLYNENKIIYHGEYIHTINQYKNDDETLFTEYHANNLVKSAKYLGSNINFSVIVDLTPASVKEQVMKNSFLAFGLFSSSDLYSEFRYGRNPLIDQIYLGAFQISGTLIRQYNSSHGHNNDLNNCYFLNDEMIGEMPSEDMSYASDLRLS